MKVKLFSHTDLDGVGCVVVAKHAFSDLDFEMLNYDEIDGRISQFIEEGKYNEYDLIFITDISVKEQVAQKIDMVNSISHSWVLLDHHPTALGLNKYDWATVNPIQFSRYDEQEEKSSGTSMLHQYLIANDMLDFSYVNERDLALDIFVEYVRQYDTWEWNTKYNHIEPKKLNDLYYIIGREEFIDRFSVDPNPTFTETEKLILELEQQRIDKYVESNEEKMVFKNVLGHGAGIVFADKYHSELGNIISKNHPEIDMVVIVNPASSAMSFRTVKDNINLGEVAKHWGGGGHPMAAGAPISKEKMEKIMDIIFA